MQKRTEIRSMSTLLLAVALAAVGIAGVATAGELKHRTATVPVPLDGVGHLATAKCPFGTKATGGGGEVVDASRTFQDASFPSSKREWTASGFRGGLATGNSELTAHVICIKGAKLKRRAESITPPSGEATPATVRCPRGTRATGGGIEIDPTDDISVGSFPSSKNEWTVVGSVDEGNPVTTHVICVDGRKVKQRSKTAVLPADDLAHSVTAECPKGTKATGGGVEIGDVLADVSAVGSYPVGKRRWTAVGDQDSGEPDNELTAHVLCLKREKKGGK